MARDLSLSRSVCSPYRIDFRLSHCRKAKPGQGGCANGLHLPKHLFPEYHSAWKAAKRRVRGKGGGGRKGKHSRSPALRSLPR